MAKVSKDLELPVAERIVQFTKEDFRENPKIVNSSAIALSCEDWKEFAQNALVLVRGKDIVQYAEEYPIVKYQCNDTVGPYLQPEYRLNSFVNDITVANVMHGNCFSVSSGKMESEFIKSDKVVYYEDRFGICYQVMQVDIHNLLLKKPELVVSPEGVLIFFVGDEILATVDCHRYCWLDEHYIDVEGKTVKSIEVCEDFCKVTLIDDKKAQYNYSLKFDFNLAARHMICPEVSEI